MDVITKSFTFNISLNSCPAYNDHEKLNCGGVKFSISRYDKYSHTILFDKPCSVPDAISAAEEYLSYPLTEEYYNKFRDDLLESEWTWEQAKNEYNNRGECLSDCGCLRYVELDDNGILSLFCGR